MKTEAVKHRNHHSLESVKVVDKNQIREKIYALPVQPRVIVNELVDPISSAIVLKRRQIETRWGKIIKFFRDVNSKQRTFYSFVDNHDS